MEDQVLHVDKEQEALSEVDLARKLHKKERRLAERLEEAQEAEARAHDRFERAEVRLQRRRSRLERIKGKLLLVQKQIADSHMHDQEPAQMEAALVMPSTAESTAEVASEEVAPVQVEQDIEAAQASNTLANGTGVGPVPVQAEQDIEVAHEPEGSSPAVAEHVSSETVEPVSVTPSEDIRTVSPTLGAEVPSSSQTETAPIRADLQQVLAASNGELGEHEWGHLAPQQEILSPASLMSAPVETTTVSEGNSLSSIEPNIPTIIELEPVANAESTAVEPEVDATPEVDTSSDFSTEREPTKPLRLEQESQPAAESPSPDVQAAKEAWVAAESAVQYARNTAHGIAASISFLSQTSGFSEKFMAELVYKQAEANKALVKAQEASRSAYERFVQAQEHAASQPVDVSVGVPGDHTRQKQENGALPAAEDTIGDQSVSMHAIRLFKAE